MQTELETQVYSFLKNGEGRREGKREERKWWGTCMHAKNGRVASHHFQTDSVHPAHRYRYLQPHDQHHRHPPTQNYVKVEDCGHPVAPVLFHSNLVLPAET